MHGLDPAPKASLCTAVPRGQVKAGSDSKCMTMLGMATGGGSVELTWVSEVQELHVAASTWNIQLLGIEMCWGL